MLGGYSEKVLTKLHGVILQALKEFDRVCRKYNITYFVGFGTAIGAARHHGFVPWDDDIDVCMMRQEYEKLRQVPITEWSSEYFIADPRDDCKIHRTLFPCFYIKGTTFETESHIKYLKPDKSGNYPIRIDIFVFDFFNDKKLHRMIKKTDNFKRLVLYSKCKYRVIKSDPLKTRISCRIKKAISMFLKITKYDSKKIYNHYLSYLQKNKGAKVTCFELVATHQKVDHVSTYQEMFPVVYLPFEDIQVPMIKNYDKIMTKSYGDYMAMPPMDQRWNGAPMVLDFGDGKGNVMQKG